MCLMHSAFGDMRLKVALEERQQAFAKFPQHATHFTFSSQCKRQCNVTTVTEV